MKTPIEILDEMIEELNPEWFIQSNTDSIVTSYLREAKERIQNLDSIQPKIIILDKKFVNVIEKDTWELMDNLNNLPPNN